MYVYIRKIDIQHKLLIYIRKESGNMFIFA